MSNTVIEAMTVLNLALMTVTLRCMTVPIVTLLFGVLGGEKGALR